MKTNSVKKIKAIAAVAIALGMSASLAMPNEAEAALGLVLVNGAAFGAGFAFVVSSQDHGLITSADKWLNFAGIILMDQKLTSVSSVSREDLLENGYSEAQADQILTDSKKLNDQLTTENKVISLTDSETLTSVRDGLRTILPDASEEFLDVFSARLFLASQTAQAQ